MLKNDFFLSIQILLFTHTFFSNHMLLLCMSPSDFLPGELSEYFGIPIYIVILIVFILGFITIRFTQKHGALKKNLKSLDDIFLIIAVGLVWLFRFYWGYRMLSPLFRDPGLYFSFWLVPIFGFVSIILIIIASIHDSEIILNRPIRSRKPIRNIKNLIFKRGEPYIPSKKIDKNIKTTNYYLVGFGILYVIAIIADKGEITPDLILSGLLLIFAFTPVIWVTITLYNYITPKK